MNLDGELSGDSTIFLICPLSAQLTRGPAQGKDILPKGNWVKMQEIFKVKELKSLGFFYIGKEKVIKR